MTDHSKVTLVLKGLTLGTLLVVQWLRLCTPNIGGPGLILGEGIRSHIRQLRPGTVKEIKTKVIEV